MPTRELLSPAQHTQFLALPSKMNKQILAGYYPYHLEVWYVIAPIVVSKISEVSLFQGESRRRAKRPRLWLFPISPISSKSIW